MKLTNKYINFILSEIETCLAGIGHSEYKIHVDFRQAASQDETLMDVQVNKNYLEALITVYPVIFNLFKNNEVELIRECVLHELVHIMLWDLCSIAEKSSTHGNKEDIETIIERTTERVARAISRPHDEIPPPNINTASSINPKKIKRKNITFSQE